MLSRSPIPEPKIGENILNEEIKKQWENKIVQLINRRIVGVRYLNELEMHNLGWTKSSIVLLLDDGNYLYPSADDEGNNAGALFTSYLNFETIPTI